MHPAGAEYNEGDQALSVGRNNLVLRELSELRRQYEGGGMSVADCTAELLMSLHVSVYARSRSPQAPEPIAEDDLGVVCYQVVLPS